MDKDININIETLRKTKGIGQKTLERIIEQHEIDNDIKSFKSKYIPSGKYKIDKDINLWQGNCLELMSHIPDKSVDMVLCDLPYGTTACSWDEVIPFEPLWSHYKRIIKDNGAIVLFGSEPFSTKLRSSNLDWYKYDWVWKKNNVTGFANAKKMPLKDYELISVFYKQPSLYNAQGLVRLNKPKHVKGNDRVVENSTQSGRQDGSLSKSYVQEYTNYPKMVIEFKNENNEHHPTQKPVKLLEYLIKTYTNEGMVVLDNTMGSGSTGVACKNTGRKFIGIELDKEYFKVAKERIYRDNYGK